MERALVAARDELFRAGEHDTTTKPVPSHVDWADAFLAMADRSLGGAARPHHERNLVLLHVGTHPDGATDGHLHLGPGLSDGLRRFVGCDARIRPVFEADGRPVSVGRAFRTVPDRTRIVIEERDRGCRVPGCERSRWLHIHHILHLGGRRGFRYREPDRIVPPAPSTASSGQGRHMRKCRRSRRNVVHR